VAPPTAKAERSFSTRELLQLRQVTLVADAAWIFSNFAPQSRHLYSKMGINILRFKYTGCLWTLQSPMTFRRRALAGTHRSRISSAFAGDVARKTA
jgi:hypothetical protein